MIWISAVLTLAETPHNHCGSCNSKNFSWRWRSKLHQSGRKIWTIYKIFVHDCRYISSVVLITRKSKFKPTSRLLHNKLNLRLASQEFWLCLQRRPISRYQNPVSCPSVPETQSIRRKEKDGERLCDFNFGKLIRDMVTGRQPGKLWLQAFQPSTF